MKRFQKGFAILEVLLLLIVVGILGGTAWYVISSKDSIYKAYDTTANSSTKASSKKSESLAYVTISDWGVRAPYSGGQTFQYKIVNQNGYAGAYFSSKELAATDQGCSVDNGAAGAISRYKYDQQVPLPGGGDGGTPAQLVASGAFGSYSKVGDYYYVFQHSQSACGSSVTSNEAQTKAQDEVKDLSTKFVANP